MKTYNIEIQVNGQIERFNEVLAVNENNACHLVIFATNEKYREIGEVITCREV